MTGKKYKYSFARGKAAAGGKESLLLAGISGLLLTAVVALSFFAGGKGGSYIGAMGLFSMMTAMFGFFLGLRSFQEKDKSHRTSIIGSVANGLLAVGWLGLFLSGV